MALSPLDAAAMQATSVSFSRYQDFQRCKFAFWLKHVEKVPEPERPLPAGKTEHANDRGSRIHGALEGFVQAPDTGKKPPALPQEATAWHDEFVRMRELHTLGRVHLEGEWGMSKDWAIAPWESAWLRLKLDALVFLTPFEVVVIDYKTGRKIGNEIKHAEQLQLYQLVTFLRFPDVQQVHAELWYIDADDLTSMSFTRDQGLRFLKGWEQKLKKITDATDFPPNPNKFSCRWCQYGQWNGGQCTKGVR